MNIKYPLDKFKQIAKSEEGWKASFPGEGEDYYTKDLMDLAHFGDFFNYFEFLGRKKLWFLKIPPQKKIRWHIDHNRASSIVFPISEQMSVQFMSGNQVFEYEYIFRPILLDVKEKHRVINGSSFERLGLYLSIFEYSFSDCIKMFKEKNMLYEY